MAGYIGAAAVPQATESRDVFTATSNQTSFATSGYTPGFVSVYLNGVHLARADYTATNGSDVVLAAGATEDDTVEIVSFSTFELSAQTFSGNVTIGDGNLVLGSTAVSSTAAELNILDGVTSTATELNQLDAITRGSILYGNASGATARLAKGSANTVLTSDGTDISWAAGGASTTAGAVGTYVWAMNDTAGAGEDFAYGSTYAGSTISPAGISSTDNVGGAATGAGRNSSYLSGTYRAMGFSDNYGSIGGRYASTLFVRTA